MYRRQECVVRARMTALLATSMNSEKDTFCKEDGCFGWLKKIPLSQRTVVGGTVYVGTAVLEFSSLQWVSSPSINKWSALLCSSLFGWTNWSFSGSASGQTEERAQTSRLLIFLCNPHAQLKRHGKCQSKEEKRDIKGFCSIFGNTCHYPKELRPDRTMGTSSRQVFQMSLGQTLRFLWAWVDSCSS